MLPTVLAADPFDLCKMMVGMPNIHGECVDEGHDLVQLGMKKASFHLGWGEPHDHFTPPGMQTIQ